MPKPLGGCNTGKAQNCGKFRAAGAVSRSDRTRVRSNPRRRSSHYRPRRDKKRGRTEVRPSRIWGLKRNPAPPPGNQYAVPAASAGGFSYDCEFLLGECSIIDQAIDASATMQPTMAVD